MNEEKRKVLEMLSQGKITVDEAEKLLAAVEGPSAEPAADAAGKRNWNYLRVLVEPGPGSDKPEKVNIRVPRKLIRAGIKFAAFMPEQAQGQVSQALKEKGINVDLAKISPQDLEDLISNLDDLTVEVDGEQKVRIFCE
jgi:DNA-directed RNA polymerase subunit F